MTTEQSSIDQLIINKPYEEPENHWSYNPATKKFSRAPGRRPAGYLIASGDSKTFDDPGVFVEIPLVNHIRQRVNAWQDAGYPGVTAITKRLLEHWSDPEEFENRQFFFYQLEAVRTLIWLAEAPDSAKVGIKVPGDDGEDFRRRCSKMATGTGKTVVMAMVIAWHILNKVTYTQDTRFAKNVLVVAPGLTVKSRLAVLEPSHPDNYYEAFRVVPFPLLDKLRQGKWWSATGTPSTGRPTNRSGRSGAWTNAGPRAMKLTSVTSSVELPVPATVPEKATFEIKWPNIIRIEHIYRPHLSLDWKAVDHLQLNASDTAQVAELAPIVDGKPDISNISSIDLEALAREYRTQKIIFEAARDVYDLMRPSWAGSRESLIAQLVRLVEQFMLSDRLVIMPALFHDDDLRRRLIITLNMAKVVQHLWDAVRIENTERLEPVFDRDHPIRSTFNMPIWYTGKPCYFTDRSHINMCVYDSTWEASEAFELDHNPLVDAWVKNDHLGFEVLYVFRGVVRKYRPDFIIRMKSGNLLVLETKGEPGDQSLSKRRALEQWTQAVTQHGGFGSWSSDISYNPADIKDILAKHHNPP